MIGDGIGMEETVGEETVIVIGDGIGMEETVGEETVGEETVGDWASAG